MLPFVIFLASCTHQHTAQAEVRTNLLRDPSFEDKHTDGKAWQRHKRGTLWDYVTASEDEIRVTDEQSRTGKYSLRFQPFTDTSHYKPRALVTSQYVNFDQDFPSSGSSALELSFWIASQESYGLQVLLDISYSDHRYMYVRVSGEDKEPGFQRVCVFIPYYGHIRAAMLHLVVEEDAVHQPVLLDDIGLLPTFTPSADCRVYTDSFPQNRHVLLDVLTPATSDDATSSITLCTQLTLDRLPSLQALADHWQGPVSAALLLFKDDPGFEEGMRTLVNIYHSSESLSKKARIHVVYEDLLHNSDQVLYPVNMLRNLALSRARTPHVFYTDADLQVTFTETQAAKWLQDAKKIASCTKCAFCIPLFQVTDLSVSVPESKSDLLEKLEQQPEVYKIYDGVSHAAVNYNRWLSTDQVYRINYRPHMEPYFIVESTSPLMNPMFAGYGRDKCAYSRDLHAAAYEFWVLPAAFLLSIQEQRPLSRDEKVSMWQRSKGVPLRMFLNSEFHSRDLEGGFHQYGVHEISRQRETPNRTEASPKNEPAGQSREEPQHRDEL